MFYMTQKNIFIINMLLCMSIAGHNNIITTKLEKHKTDKLEFENSGSQMLWEDSIIYNRKHPPKNTHTHTHVICIAV
jgi:hypothetical protein